VAMTIYHFAWDLEFFNWTVPGLTLRPEWTLFARLIASSFLFLVGVSLVLAHGNGIRWKGFWKRFALVAGAAALISVATYFAVPGGFIFFGILHGIALFSLLGLAFVRFHGLVALIAAVLVLAVWWGWSNEVFFNPALWWVGLAPTPPPSNDYVPLFPWFAATLAGIGLTKLALPLSMFKAKTEAAQNTSDGPVNKSLSFLGRHSLVYYLVHQPVMIGMIWVFTAIAGAPDKGPVFVYQCVQECQRTNGPLFCKPYCSCMEETLKQEKLFTPFIDRTLSEEQNSQLLTARDQCLAEQQ